MQAEILNRAINLYTREDLVARIASCEKILTYANGELAWDVSFELSEYREILAEMDARTELRSDIHLHTVGY
jgi:hypothetical protein